MKRIFILTGEASGDILASKAIIDLKIINPNIEYLSVGGENLKKIPRFGFVDLNSREKDKNKNRYYKRIIKIQ